MVRRYVTIALINLVVAVCGQSEGTAQAAKKPVFRAGAAAVDITPTEFPVIVSGGFLERKSSTLHDPLHARCLVLDDGTTRLAVVVVDSLMMPRELIDDAKAQAEKTTGIPADRMLVAATHTHSAPSVCGALGSGVDERYAAKLPAWIAQTIERANRGLTPARIGWAAVADPQHTNCRRWIRRPDRIGTDPFSDETVRAMMHPGYQNPDYVGPAGPKDPLLTVLAVQTPEGRPVAVLANYSMHYFGSQPVSADYYGLFCQKLADLLAPAAGQTPLVTVMSQGTSGDLHWMDYSRPATSIHIDQYAQQVAQVAFDAYRKIAYRDWVPLAMAERKLTLQRRVPDEKRLAWAKKIIAEMPSPLPRNRPEVYAHEQIFLHEQPQRELKLQAIRVGDLGMVAMPCEVFGLTGLKIKIQSPLEPTMNFELANGAEGYIPPPEQHKLGGYTTWPARSAGLEVQAEPTIVAATLELLEQVAARPRRTAVEPLGMYARSVLASRPVAYWRLGETAGPQAADATEHNHQGVYEDGVAFALEGMPDPGASGIAAHRAAHFAGGRMKAALAGLGDTYSVELWFSCGLPSDARAVTGYLFSRGPDGSPDAAGEHLGIGGTHSHQGKLIFFDGNTPNELLGGTTDIQLRVWNYAVLVREGRRLRVYLNGKRSPEISGEAASNLPAGADQVFVGGRNDRRFNFEGKVDEVAVYDRALSPEEIDRHYTTARPR